MQSISELRTILKQQLNWNKARIDCLTKMILALLKCRTVNLQVVAEHFDSSNNKVDSNYRRLQNFLRWFKMDYLALGRWLFKLFFSDDQPCYLSLDRTVWYWGKKPNNMLTLGGLYEGIAIPLFWEVLGKAGNSAVEDRQALVQRFIDQCGLRSIAGLIMDREFVGKRWMQWLVDKGVPFYARIKDNLITYNHRHQNILIKYLFNDLNPKEKRVYPQPFKVYGQRLYLAGARSEKGDLVVIATNQDPQSALAIYYQRWGIETLFQSLKTRGFHLEATHVTHPERLKKLMGVVAMAFSWAHKIGEWQNKINPIRMKWHAKSKEYRYQYNFPRYGLIWLTQQFSRGQKSKAIKQILKLVVPDIGNAVKHCKGGAV